MKFEMPEKTRKKNTSMDPCGGYNSWSVFGWQRKIRHMKML